MHETIRTHLDNIRSDDNDTRNTAYYALLEITEKPVDWAYEAWDEIVAALRHSNNHTRAIAAQIFANLAKSDPENRMSKDFDSLLNLTRDAKFVTARHALQSIWKVGLGGQEQCQQLVAGLETRFKECAAEKNTTLIRYDIIQGLRNLYNVVKDDHIKQTALAWIETEDDLKYRKKYAGVWKKA